MSLCATIVERGGPDCRNVLVILFLNAVKFAWMALLAPVTMAWRRVRALRHAGLTHTRNR